MCLQRSRLSREAMTVHLGANEVGGAICKWVVGRTERNRALKSLLADTRSFLVDIGAEDSDNGFQPSIQS